MIAAANSVALVVGYGSLLWGLVIALIMLACSVRDQLKADEWRAERERQEHYARCDSYAHAARIVPFRCREDSHGPGGPSPA